MALRDIVELFDTGTTLFRFGLGREVDVVKSAPAYINTPSPFGLTVGTVVHRVRGRAPGRCRPRLMTHGGGGGGGSLAVNAGMDLVLIADVGVLEDVRHSLPRHSMASTLSRSPPQVVSASVQICRTTGRPVRLVES